MSSPIWILEAGFSAIAIFGAGYEYLSESM
jgi:hypothetical protein